MDGPRSQVPAVWAVSEPEYQWQAALANNYFSPFRTISTAELTLHGYQQDAVIQSELGFSY